MKCKKLLAMVVGLVILVSPIAGLPFDTQPGPLRGFEAWSAGPDYQEYESQSFVDVSGTFTRCLVLGTAEGFYSDFDQDGNLISRRAVGVFGQEGSTFYAGNGYWVTNYHVVVPESIKIEISDWMSIVTYPVKIITRLVNIGQLTGLGSAPAEIIYLDQERDIAILRVMGNWPGMVDQGYRPVFTKDLEVGSSVAVIVAIRTSPETEDLSKTPWFEVRYGTIVSTGVRLPSGLPTDLLPWFSLNDVTMTTTIYPGDSGSAVFAFIDGKPVIVGIARAAAATQDYYTGEISYYSYFTRIDMVVPFIIEK